MRQAANNVTFHVNCLVAVGNARTVRQECRVLRFRFKETSSLVRRTCNVVTRRRSVLVLNYVGQRRQNAFLCRQDVLRRRGTLVTCLTNDNVVLFHDCQAVKFLAIRHHARCRTGGTKDLIVCYERQRFTVFRRLRMEINGMVVIVNGCALKHRAINMEARFGVRAISNDFVNIINATPINGSATIRLPIVFRGLIRYRVIVTNILTTGLVMDTRGTPNASFFCHDLRYERVSFVRDAITGVRVGVSTPRFLIIRHVILSADYRSILLRLLSMECTRRANRVEILTRVFGVAPIRQDTMSISTKTRRRVLFAVTHFLASNLTVLNERIQVPNDNRADRNQRDNGTIVNPINVSPIVPISFNASAIETITRPGLKGTRPQGAHATRFALHVTGNCLLFRHRPTRNVLCAYFGELHVIRVSQYLYERNASKTYGGWNYWGFVLRILVNWCTGIPVDASGCRLALVTIITFSDPSTMTIALAPPNSPLFYDAAERFP